MKVETFSYRTEDELASNTYVISDNKRNAIVVDPSLDYDGIINNIDKNNLKLKAVLLTHGHFDHIRGVDKLIKKFEVPLYCHSLEEELLKNPNNNCSCDFKEKIIVLSDPILLADGQILDIIGDKIKVIHTPYHTAGSVCYLLINSKLLFSGDSLFKLTIGRDDLPTSVPKEKHNSLMKIMSLEDDIKVYPGHGNSTTLGYERTFNRFINR